MSIKDKLIILENYDKLPTYMSEAKKAENLGLKRGHLLSILSCRDKILLMRNTDMKRLSYGKEREVANATIKWVQSAMALNAKISHSVICAKASEEAGKMGKTFSPSMSWSQRLCKRANICLEARKQNRSVKSREAAEKLVTTYEAMEALDVVYNFLMQNDGSQPCLMALEKIMWFVDEKQQNHLPGRVESIKKMHYGYLKNRQKPEQATVGEHTSKDNNLINALEGLLFKCGECPYAFSSKDDVELHRKGAHNITTMEGNMLDEVEVDIEDDHAERDKTSNKEDTEGNEHEFLPKINEVMTIEEEVPIQNTNNQEKSQKRNSLTIQEKQHLIKRYENLPKMAQVHKAKLLGLNLSTLRKILSKREQILACQNTAMKRARRGKEGNSLDEGVEALKLQKEESSSSLEDDAALDLEADISPITCSKRATDDDDSNSLACNKCGLVLGSKPELVDHMAYIHTGTEHDKVPESKEVVITDEELEDNSDNQGKYKRRICMTIQEKQTIIKQYENLPSNITQARKAKMLGIKNQTLNNILSNRENILAFQNTTMKRARHAKEKEVAEATLEWVQSARARNERISYSIIQRKASELAGKMGKNFSPSTSWCSRLCKRGNISLKIENNDALTKVREDDTGADNTGYEETSVVNDGDDIIMLKTEEEHPDDACVTPRDDEIKKQLSCQECDLDFEMQDELQHHLVISHDKLPETEDVKEEQVPREKATHQGKVGTRTFQTFQQKQDIIKQYENLPENLSIKKKAEILGVKRTTLMKIVSNKEKIMSVQNTTRKNLRYGKDEEVEKATLMWLQSAIQSGVSYATIRAKATEIAHEMDRDFTPGAGWASRFCKRHNLNLGKDESGEIIEEEDTSRATDPIL